MRPGAMLYKIILQSTWRIVPRDLRPSSRLLGASSPASSFYSSLSKFLFSILLLNILANPVFILLGLAGAKTQIKEKV